jgi:hypothetical protein
MQSIHFQTRQNVAGKTPGENPIAVNNNNNNNNNNKVMTLAKHIPSVSTLL